MKHGDDEFLGGRRSVVERARALHGLLRRGHCQGFLIALSAEEANMFTYKFEGLVAPDATTPYHYGSLPAKPELGHVLFYESGNRYAVTRIDGEGLVGDGDGYAEQRELAWADISRGEKVPTLWLQKLAPKETRPQGRSFSYEEVKEYSQKNRETRLSASTKF